MSIYENFCTETVDANGTLTNISLQYPENFNFAYDVVDAIAARTPEKRALVWANTLIQRTLTFGELSALSNQYANVFREAGIKRGSVVMVVLKRHLEYWLCALALHKLGACMLPATHMLTADDVVYRLQEVHPAAIIATSQDGFPEVVRTAIAKSGEQPILWTNVDDVADFRNLPAEAAEQSVEFPRVETHVTDAMLLYFTSGTTDYPKGVVHNYSYPLAHIVTAKYWQGCFDGGLHFTISETGWGKASWGKIYGQWLTECAVMVYDFDTFDPKHLPSIINQFGVTSFCAPPTIYRYLVRRRFEPMPTLTHASTAGEAMDGEIYRKFKEQTGMDICGGYGQTETTLLLANFIGQTPKDTSLGYPNPLYNIDLLTEDGRSADVGEIGEIVIRPPEDASQVGLFSAYTGNASLYAHAFRGGVYHTGDSAWRDEDGCYFFHARVDDVIKSGGYRIGPFEVEDVLAKHPAVLECKVIGVPDTWRGQAIKAIVVAAPGYTADRTLAKELIQFANSRMAEYKWIRHLEFIDAMPKTISGKIQTSALKTNEKKASENKP